MVRVLVTVASAQNEPEAQMICARLSAEGVDALYKRGPGADAPHLGPGGGREIYVEAQDAARARVVLSVPEFSDAELAALSDQAGRELAEKSSPSPASSP
jgi:hypothetical protein